jgi:hypothetical protein
MSWALLRKRDVELTAGDIEEPADDPREQLALRHNIRQLQREIELIRVEQQIAIDEMRAGYEDRLTECRAALSERS